MANPTSSPEEWRPVVGYEGLYEVSNLGRVRSNDRTVVLAYPRIGVCSQTRKGKLLKPTPARHSDGGIARMQVSLLRDGERKTGRVHVLVAEAFLGPRPSGKEVAHFDGDATNNTVPNLRYATPLENAADRDRHGMTPRGEAVVGAKLTAVQALKVRRLKGVETLRETAERYGISRTHVSTIQRGGAWRHL